MGYKKEIANKIEDKLDQARFKIKDKLGLFDPVILYPYRGYGNEHTAYLKGRVLEKEGALHGDSAEDEGLWANVRKVWNRYESDEIPGVKIHAELAGCKASCLSDRDGYFELIFRKLPLDLKNGWHSVHLTITEMPFDLEFEDEAIGEVLISDQREAFGIISDVDDTIIKSNAMNPLQKMKTLLLNDAKSRKAFDGVEDLYDHLNCEGLNPLFFVSGSSYNLYDMLCKFCTVNKIPKAPFFLRNLGLNADQWLKQDTSPYKKEHIEHIFEVFPNLSFILIGDSGQKDPEIYLSLLKMYPKRIKAIYIRHVHNDSRKVELTNMTSELSIPFMVLENSHDALLHCKEMGWVKN